MTSNRRSKSYRFQWDRAAQYIAGRDKEVNKALITAWYLASCANTDGTSIRPGHQAIAEHINRTTKTVGTHIGILINAGLIHEDSPGRSAGRGGGTGLAAEYSLTIPDPLMTGNNTSDNSDGKTRTKTSDQSELMTGSETGMTGSETSNDANTDFAPPIIYTNQKHQSSAVTTGPRDPSPPVPREPEAGQGDTSDTAPHVPQPEVFSEKEEQNIPLVHFIDCAYCPNTMTVDEAEANDCVCADCR